jgi:hypothetical protein
VIINLIRYMAVLLAACAPVVRSGAGPDRTVELRRGPAEPMKLPLQAGGEVERRTVIVTFSYSNPCRLPLRRARIRREGSTVHLLPEWPPVDPNRVCPDALALEGYQARLTGLAPGDYTVLVHHTAREERTAFPPVRLRVGGR